jgi:hypothetical protein
MSIDEERTHWAGTLPAEPADESRLPTAALAYFMEELSSIEERIATIEQMQGDCDIGVDELLDECVSVWSRIKQLQLRIGPVIA